MAENNNWNRKRPDVGTDGLKAMRLDGYSYKAIANHFGMSASGVHQRLAKAAEPEKQKATWQEIVARKMICSARKRAKLEGVPFMLQKGDVVIPDSCPVLGIPLILGSGRLNENSPSLDKIIPELGYIPSNVWIISWRANRCKSNLSVDEILRLARALELKIKGESS